jgi:hypothetical protein
VFGSNIFYDAYVFNQGLAQIAQDVAAPNSRSLIIEYQDGGNIWHEKICPQPYIETVNLRDVDRYQRSGIQLELHDLKVNGIAVKGYSESSLRNCAQYWVDAIADRHGLPQGGIQADYISLLPIEGGMFWELVLRRKESQR